MPKKRSTLDYRGIEVGKGLFGVSLVARVRERIVSE